MNFEDPIGRVIATEKDPSTTDQVRFWLAPDVDLKPFDFVRLSGPESMDRSVGDFYALIQEIHHVSDEPSALSGFVSADFGQSTLTPRVERVVATYADAMVIFNTEDIEMPIPHGSPVYWPDEAGVRRALGILDYRRPTPAGYITMSGPGKALTIHVDMDADYLIGPEGAHLNVSGISGLATKTSYAMFLLTAIQQKQREWSGSDSARAAFVVFNVKSADLLSVHEEADDLDDKTRDEWAKCGLDAEPLRDVVYFYPYADTGARAQTKLDDAAVERNMSEDRAYRYYYDVDAVLDRLHLLVEDIDDPAQTLVSCVDYCRDNVERTLTWTGFKNKIQGWADKTPDSKIPVVSWRRFLRLFRQRTKNRVFVDEGVKAHARRQVLLDRLLNHLRPGRVLVIDIAPLPDYLQSFVVGDVIGLLRRAKMGVNPEDYADDAEAIEESAPDEIGTVILVADELNKFAPQYAQARSITRHLREVSERGRSDGIILFGAEQFRTGVDKQVTGNSGTQVFGRTTAVEANRDPEIKGLPGNQSRRVPFLRKGELLVSHTRFSSGTLKVRFPRNAYRTG